MHMCTLCIPGAQGGQKGYGFPRTGVRLLVLDLEDRSPATVRMYVLVLLMYTVCKNSATYTHSYLKDVLQRDPRIAPNTL